MREMIIRHLLAKLGSSLTCKESYGEAAKLQTALLHAALFKYDSLPKNAKNQIVDARLCYKGPQCTLAHPPDILVHELNGYVKNVWSIHTVFDKGAALEFLFYMEAKHGLVATHLKTNNEFAIPAVEETWVQTSHGSILSFVGNDYLMVKLAQSYCY